MKSLFSFVAFVLLSMVTSTISAQYMPIVYDNNFNSNTEIISVESDFLSGDVVLATQKNDRKIIGWLNRDGVPVSVKEFKADELNTVSNLIALSADELLIVGDYVAVKASKGQPAQVRGVVIVLSKTGNIVRRSEVGPHGTTLVNAQLLDNQSFIVSGRSVDKKGDHKGFIAKLSAIDRSIYEYFAPYGSVCNHFTVQQGVGENVFVLFTGENNEGSSVVRLDESGKPYYITRFTDEAFKAEKMLLTKNQEVVVVGQGEKSGGAVVKIRKEGDIVFQKQVIPTTPITKFTQLELSEDGCILVGGNDAQNAFYSLLRNDGTALSANVDKGYVSSIAVNATTGESVISLYNDATQSGKVIKLSKDGKKMFETSTVAMYSDLAFNYFGDIMMVSASSGRISQLSSVGNLLFDRYVTENTPQTFNQAILPVNGSVVFVGASGRLAKLAHGIYVSDVKVLKPINGITNAVFTINLSGFSFTNEGAPIPVSVDYITHEGTAKIGRNFNPVKGTLSFIPSSDRTEKYLRKYVVEVPVKSNDMLEGDRVFSLNLSNAKDSYVIRGKSEAVIEDQPVIVRLNSTTPGYEGGSNINYELGIYKTNGTPLTNDTGADIVIDGVYAKGSADDLDFQKGRIPRVTINTLKHNGNFEVIPLEDTRYESTKTVVIEFNKVYAMSDTDISFMGDELISIGDLYDQPAMVAVESLGNIGKTSNIVSGLFKVSLLRARDGALLTNNSGSDVIVSLSTDAEATAELSKDYIFTNLHNARIWGDGTSSAVNIDGVLMYNADKSDKIKTVGIKIEKAKVGTDALPISISPEASKSMFEITNLNNIY